MTAERCAIWDSAGLGLPGGEHVFVCAVRRHGIVTKVRFSPTRLPEPEPPPGEEGLFARRRSRFEADLNGVTNQRSWANGNSRLGGGPRSAPHLRDDGDGDVGDAVVPARTGLIFRFSSGRRLRLARSLAEFAALSPIADRRVTYLWALGESSPDHRLDMIIEYASAYRRRDRMVGTLSGADKSFRGQSSSLAGDRLPQCPRCEQSGRGGLDRRRDAVPRVGVGPGADAVRASGDHQLAGGPRGLRDHDRAGHRHQGVGELEQRDGDSQDRHILFFSRSASLITPEN